MSNEDNLKLAWDCGAQLIDMGNRALKYGELPEPGASVRVEFYSQHQLEDYTWKTVEACAAIKDAEIADLNMQIHIMSTKISCEVLEAQAEIASSDLMIKELRETVQQLTSICVTQVAGDYNDVIHAAYVQGKQALANSEHHNSRALEKMLLEARIDALEMVHSYHPLEGNFDSYVAGAKFALVTKLAELNRE